MSETEHLLERVGFTVLESGYTFGVFATKLARELEQCIKVARGSRDLSRLGRPVLNGLATLEFVFGIPDDDNILIVWRKSFNLKGNMETYHEPKLSISAPFHERLA